MSKLNFIDKDTVLFTVFTIIFFTILIELGSYAYSISNNFIEKDEHIVDPDTNKVNVVIGLEEEIKGLDYIVYNIDGDLYKIDNNNLQKTITFEIEEDKTIDCSAIIRGRPLFNYKYPSSRTERDCDLNFRIGEWKTMEKVVL